MPRGWPQLLTEMSTRSISWGKGGRCERMTTFPPSCAIVTKYVNLNVLEPSGPVQACNGTALPYIAQVSPKDGKILTLINAINYLILLPLSVFRCSRLMLIRWWPSGLLHDVICSFRRFGWPCCLRLHNDWNWFRFMLQQVPPKRRICRIKPISPLFERCLGL